MGASDDTAHEAAHDAAHDAARAAVERMLDRVRFDLHDGPQQDVHLLGMDLALFREQVLPSLADHPNRDRLLGRLDDLAAQLIALDQSLRRLTTSLESPFLAHGTLPDALTESAEAFAARTGVVPHLQMTGEFQSLSDSQQIAVLAVVHEALSNIRKHGDPTTVTIAVSAGERGVDLRIVNDGQGFDPATRLGQARADGHLGIVGMQGRVRMLGGETHIESRPGGPTVVSAWLPPWSRPVAEAP